jgi:hypothetical protein
LSETIRLFQAETLSQVRGVSTLDVRNLFPPCKGRARLASLGIKSSAACFKLGQSGSGSDMPRLSDTSSPRGGRLCQGTGRHPGRRAADPRRPHPHGEARRLGAEGPRAGRAGPHHGRGGWHHRRPLPGAV